MPEREEAIRPERAQEIIQDMAKRRLFIVNDPRSEAAHADFVLCHRVRDVPIVASSSTIAHCRDCGERIWVSPKAPVKPPRLCRSCCENMMTESGKKADFVTACQWQKSGPARNEGSILVLQRAATLLNGRDNPSHYRGDEPLKALPTGRVQREDVP